jgi:hypothetical protein
VFQRNHPNEPVASTLFAAREVWKWGDLRRIAGELPQVELDVPAGLIGFQNTISVHDEHGAYSKPNSVTKRHAPLGPGRQAGETRVALTGTSPFLKL